jgi:hypothetical protein
MWLESRRMSQTASPLRRVPEVQLVFDPATLARWYPLRESWRQGGCRQKSRQVLPVRSAVALAHLLAPTMRRAQPAAALKRFRLRPV